MPTVFPLEIIYLADPMCSWCYGFSPEITQLKNDYAEKAKFTLIMGGLRAGGGDAWDEQMKNFLKDHWKHVHEESGQEFGYELFEKEHFDYDTEPACRAVRVVREMSPKQEFDFFKAIQKGFYLENKDPKSVDFYKPICEKLNIPFIVFRSKFLSPKYKELLQMDFDVCKNWGIRGFPTVVLGIDGGYKIVVNGYTKYENLKSKIEYLIAAVRN
ncbi:MAG: DsbA family protein [Chitinophagales bacterium]